MAFKVKKNKGWKKIGVVGVDSGTLLLGDPAYSKDLKYNKDVVGMKRDTSQLKFKKGYTGRGVLTRTGFGDGLYDVFAKTKKTKYGTRVDEVKVKFITPKEEKLMKQLVERK